MKPASALPITILLLAFGITAPYWTSLVFGSGGRLISWFVEAILVGVVILFIVPPGISSNPLQNLILDERGIPEVSRMLTLMWFIIIMSAYLACALWNVAVWTPSSDAAADILPLGIEIPPEIWLLAGIVVVPVIGAAIITNLKLKSGLFPRTTKDTISTDIPFSNMFIFETATDSRNVELTAVFQFLIQVSAFVAYVAALGRLMYLTPAAAFIFRFPGISDGVLVIAAGMAGAYITMRAIAR